MKLLLLASAVLSPSAAAPLPLASPPQTRVVGGACDKLAWDWRHVEKRMAFDFARESLKYDPPSATEVHLAEANDLARSSLILQLMRDNGCPAPTSAPNMGTYAEATFACIRARQAKAADAPVLCDEERWLPNR